MKTRMSRGCGVLAFAVAAAFSAPAWSQAQNLEAAKERLKERLEALFHKPIPRVATKRPRSSKIKRVESKRHRGDIKRARRFSGDD